MADDTLGGKELGPFRYIERRRGISYPRELMDVRLSCDTRKLGVKHQTRKQRALHTIASRLSRSGGASSPAKPSATLAGRH